MTYANWTLTEAGRHAPVRRDTDAAGILFTAFWTFVACIPFALLAGWHVGTLVSFAAIAALRGF